MKKFAVVGHEISYSLSPKLHSIIYKELGIDASYVIEDILPQEFDSEIVRCLKEYDGFNVTKPYKKDILNFVSSEFVAVNTVVSEAKIGYNTDGIGFYADLTQFAGEVRGKQILVLGVGGAGDIVARTLASYGSNVVLYNRTADKAEKLASEIGASTQANKCIDIIVNCTTYPPVCGWEEFLSGYEFASECYAYDLIYTSKVTPFLEGMKKHNAHLCNGLGMLVNQAIKSSEYFLGISVDSELSAKIKRKVEENIL